MNVVGLYQADIKCMHSSVAVLQTETEQFHRNNIEKQSTLSEYFSLAKKFAFLLYMEFATEQLK